MKRFTFLFLVLIVTNNQGFSQVLDTVVYNFGLGNFSITKYSNLGVYYVNDSTNIDSNEFGNYLVKKIGDNIFILNDSGENIQPNFPFMFISNSRLYKHIDCNSILDDTLSCYVLTNKVTGLFDTIYKIDFLNFLEDSMVSNFEIEGNYFSILLPIDKDILEFSAMIANCEFVTRAGPDIPMIGKLASSDPYYSFYQYYLKNSFTGQFDINVEPAWELTKGNSQFTIGILDDGVSNNHPDLNSSKLIIKNFTNFANGKYWYEKNNDNGPKYWAYDLNLYPWDDLNKPIPNKYLRQIHGTAMAGVIGADHNEIGMRGVAPNCKIFPIKFSIDANSQVNRAPFNYDSYYSQIFRTIYKEKWEIDVLNCSFYLGYFHTSGYNIPVVYEWIYKLVRTEGRKGRGMTIVASSGNEVSGPNSDGACYNVYLPAGIKVNGIIGVGACDRNGIIANYSTCGEGLDLVAIANSLDNNGFYYSEDIFTLDEPGIGGYNPTNITEKFTSYPKYRSFNGSAFPATGANFEDYIGFGGGTSIATAQVSGAVGLLLSQNPCLKSTEIEVILKRNAKKVNQNIYNYYIKISEPGWSKELGYGLLDVFQSLVDPLWDQNVNYTSDFGVKGGTIYAGENVTSSKPAGNVIIGSGGNVTYLAFKTIEIYEGFEVDNNGEFLAEIYQPDFPNCSNWDKVDIPILGEIYEEIDSDYDQLVKINETGYSLISNNERYIFNSINSTENVSNKVATTNDVSLKIFPNPNNQENLKMVFSKQVNLVEIIIRDMAGSEVYKIARNIQSDRIEYDDIIVKPGIYFIQINVDGEKFFKKNNFFLVKGNFCILAKWVLFNQLVHNETNHF